MRGERMRQHTDRAYQRNATYQPNNLRGRLT